MEAVQPVLEEQSRSSAIPAPNHLLIEHCISREGQHIFMFPFAGRLVLQGLSALLAWRLARTVPQTIRVTANDYGMELLSQKPWDMDEADWRRHLSTDHLTDDLIQCLNATEMARRRFRDIARIAGLIFQGYPGEGKKTKQLQASSSLFYDVFVQYDPGNLLVDQARREVLETQLDYVRLKETLEAIRDLAFVFTRPPRFSPLAFPIWAERMQQSAVSTESWKDRVQRMQLQRERIETVKKSTLPESSETFNRRWKRRAAAVPKNSPLV